MPAQPCRAARSPRPQPSAASTQPRKPIAVVATTTSGGCVDQLLGGGQQFAVVGERHDPQGGRVQHGGAAPLEQRAELVGAARGGHPDGEAREGGRPWSRRWRTVVVTDPSRSSVPLCGGVVPVRHPADARPTGRPEHGAAATGPWSSPPVTSRIRGVVELRLRLDAGVGLRARCARRPGGPKVYGPGDREAHGVEGEEGDERRVPEPAVRKDCRKARLMPTPPSAPTAPISPMEAPDSRRPYAAASSPPSSPWPAAFAWKMPGIILYVEPLPRPAEHEQHDEADE